MTLDVINPSHFSNLDCWYGRSANRSNGLPGGNGEWEPPDPIPNSEVKLLSADDSVGPPHVKVGHCQALNAKPPIRKYRGFFYAENYSILQFVYS